MDAASLLIGIFCGLLIAGVAGFVVVVMFAKALAALLFD